MDLDHLGDLLDLLVRASLLLLEGLPDPLGLVHLGGLGGLVLLEAPLDLRLLEGLLDL